MKENIKIYSQKKDSLLILVLYLVAGVLFNLILRFSNAEQHSFVAIILLLIGFGIGITRYLMGYDFYKYYLGLSSTEVLFAKLRDSKRLQFRKEVDQIAISNISKVGLSKEFGHIRMYFLLNDGNLKSWELQEISESKIEEFIKDLTSQHPQIEIERK